jgi:hypothetical protein
LVFDGLNLVEEEPFDPQRILSTYNFYHDLAFHLNQVVYDPNVILQVFFVEQDRASEFILHEPKQTFGVLLHEFTFTYKRFVEFGLYMK